MLSTPFHKMTRLIGCLITLGTLPWLGALQGAVQETLVPPLEIKQDQTLYNYQSLRGVPIPAGMVGSDSRLIPYPNNTGSSENPATINQFSGLISYGGVAAPGNASGLVSGMSYTANAQNIELPRGENGVTGLVLSRAQVGAPFLNRPVSFLFGGIIPLPDEDEDGVKLDASVPAESFWRREPHLADGETHVSKGYYFSPHAQVIFAIQAGPISITWRKVLPESVQPSDSSDTTKWLEDGGNWYRLYPKRYVVSGSAAKEPKTIYWNTAGYNGPSVMIPTASIQELEIVYNQAFPAEVANGTPAGNNSFTSSGDNPVEIVIKKTLWRDGNELKASTQQAGCSWNCWETSVGMGGRASISALKLWMWSNIPFPLISPLSWGIASRLTDQGRGTLPITPTSPPMCSRMRPVPISLPMKWDARAREMPSTMPSEKPST